MATKKKPAAKKPAAKKPVKKAAAKKAPAKKPAAKAKKPAAKKPAAKKPVKKAAAKKAPAKKSAAKVAAKKAPVKKTSLPTSMPKEKLDPNVPMRNLFDAYANNKLPFAQGYIISSFFSETTAYSIYEIITYAGVKEIFLTGEGLQFVTGGKKLYVMIQNDTYDKKFIEPVSRSRSSGESIPKRFVELNEITCKNQYKIFVAKEPDEIYGSFTILRPTSINFSVVFYQLPDVYENIKKFFIESMNRTRKVPEHDAKEAAKLIADTIQKYMGNLSSFE